MRKQIFTWDPFTGMTADVKFEVSTAQFGDGYSQAAAAGINNRTGSWPLTFTDRDEVIAAIMRFLDWHKGAASFWWTPPLGTPGLYRCAEYGPSKLPGAMSTVTATFIEVGSV
jgi:phage-related protein